METTNIDQDIKVLYLPATSFPDGIKEAHEKLHSIIPFTNERKYFGISRPENGEIKYKAAAEELTEGEAENFNLKTLILKKGNYVSLTVQDYMKDIPAIGKAFKKLLSYPGLDPQGYCVEWYLDNRDVKCMIRLKE
jgi:predicted transcriptional regulator YdeE